METYSIESTCGHVRAEEYCISSKELIFLIVASDQVGAALSSQVSDPNGWMIALLLTRNEAGLEHAHKKATCDQSGYSSREPLS